MVFISLFCFVLCVAGAVIILDITPKRVSDDLHSLMKPKVSIRSRAMAARGQKKENKIIAALVRIQSALEVTGRTGSFGIICIAAFSVVLAGFILAFTFGLYYLIPVAAVGGALLPFFSAESAVEAYDRRMNEELETALSVVTAAYLRTGNIVGAVEESLPEIREPAKELFRQFYVNATLLSSDTVNCIRRLENSSENRVFRDWCEIMLACQDDSSNRDALMPAVSELTEVRLANSEMVTVINECRKEYFGMVFLTLGNIPLLYILNEDWWDTLIHTAAGHCALAVVGVTVLVTSFLMMKYTRPLELKRRK